MPAFLPPLFRVGAAAEHPLLRLKYFTTYFMEMQAKSAVFLFFGGPSARSYQAAAFPCRSSRSAAFHIQSDAASKVKFRPPL